MTLINPTREQLEYLYNYCIAKKLPPHTSELEDIRLDETHHCCLHVTVKVSSPYDNHHKIENTKWTTHFQKFTMCLCEPSTFIKTVKLNEIVSAINRGNNLKYIINL
ncbi:MAG: hypothetical protein EOO43_08380 [Flavobacterium sp.]|nr:MAG: hypothetical protein EOO43_08380 [Flavobacterium sp.]